MLLPLHSLPPQKFNILLISLLLPESYLELLWFIFFKSIYLLFIFYLLI